MDISFLVWIAVGVAGTLIYQHFRNQVKEEVQKQEEQDKNVTK